MLGAGVAGGAVVVVAVVWQRVLASEPQQAAPTDRNRSPTDWLNAADVYQLVDPPISTGSDPSPEHPIKFSVCSAVSAPISTGSAPSP